MKKVLLMLLFVIVALGVSACGKENLEKGNDNMVILNSELDGVNGFAQQVMDNQYKIVALKDDGSTFDITDYSDIKYDTLDYSSGKLYMQKDDIFYIIDLTKGNGEYDVNSILTYDFDTPSYYKSMGVYEGKIYFNADQDNLMVYDIVNDKTYEVIDDEEIVSFYLNKDYGKIYYIERSDKCYLKEYDIETGEIRIIDTGDTQEVYGYTYNFNIGIINGNGDALIYSKEENVNDMRKTRFYYYDYVNDDKVLVDESLMSGIYSDGKLYYAASVSEEMYPDYEFKVQDGDDVMVIMEPQPNSFINFFDLGNGKIQAVMNFGQDISTYGEQAYVIDKDSLEISQVDDNYNLVYLIHDIDNELLDIS